MKDCLICHEKQKRIDTILRAYKADKRLYQKVIIGSFALNLLVLAFGSQGLTVALDFIKGLIK